MYKDFTDEITAYKIINKDNLPEVQTILTEYLKEYDVWNEDRDMTIEGNNFAKGSAFYDVFIRNGRLNELFEPIYAKISLSKDYMTSLGFKTIKDDGQYGEAIDIRTNGMTTIQWNREGRSCTYFGEKLEPNIGITIKKDGGTRTAFNGYIFNESNLKVLLKQTW